MKPAMKIDNKPFDRNSGVAGAEAATSQIRDAGHKSRGGLMFASGDSVSLSRMTDLVALASRVGESARAEHVNRIAAQYRSGSYVVNNEALAQALIDRAFEG